MTRPFSAELAFTCDDAAEALAVMGALDVEAAEGLPRATARLDRDGVAVVVRLDADDAVALRAAVNAFTRWAAVAADAVAAGRPQAN